MADGFSTTFANAILNILKGTAPTTYSTVYAQLHTGPPGSAGTTNISAGSTAREAVTFGTVSAGSLPITTPDASWTNGGTTETVTDLSFWSATSGGTFIFSGALATAKSWSSGDPFTLSGNSLSIPTAS